MMLSSSKRETILAIGLIVLATLLTYGVLISQLGFYRDDWYLLWTAESQGMAGILNLFRGDRPFVGWLYSFDFSILGVSPFGWQLYVLCIKSVSALAFFWLVRSVWPERKVETTFITLLFIVYPGFYQQPNALTFKQLLLAYTAALLSLALTVQVAKTNRLSFRVVFSVLAVALTALYIFIYEALVGMELARIFLLWNIFYRQNIKWRESIRLAILRCIPYLSFTALFVFWRIFIFQSSRKATSVEALAGSYTSLHGLTRLLVETGKDFVETSILAWGAPYYQFTAQATYKDMGLALGLGLLVVMASAGYYLLVRKQACPERSRWVEVPADAAQKASLDWLVLGAVIVLATTLPVVAAGRNVLFGIQWDRYTYQSVLGAALLAGGFVFYALRGNMRWLVLALLLISGVSTQVFSGIYYRDFWSAQRDAWWQLYWRAPQIEDGTTVIAALPTGFQLAEEYEVWGPLNLVYHRGGPLRVVGQVPYDQLVIDLARGTEEQRLVRGTVPVNRDYNRVMVVSIPTTKSCLHVYNGTLLELSVSESPDVALIAPYSRTDFILTDAASPAPPTQIMGIEPMHDWCYYYQKIGLSLQAGRWADAARLADAALTNDLRPEDPVEWMPVLEAYANNSEDVKAKQVSKYINDAYTRMSLCQQLKDISKWPAGYRSEVILDNLCRSH
jgi:hypothetical protein